ncbi:Der GTPase-activating protein YihI [Thalassotalea fusca]
MTRKKKSRKPGVGSIGAVKESKLAFTPSDKKPKKKTGKTAGNRQQEALNKKGTDNRTKAVTDPRIGSKKPIALGTPVAEKTKQPAKKSASQSPIAAIKVMQSSLSTADKIAAIETDEKLQGIVEKIDQDIALTEEEVYYYNDLMEQHEQLSDQLATETADEMPKKQAVDIDDDALWDKFDSADFDDLEY